MLHIGQVYQSTITVQNQDTAPSGATLTITKPDGTHEDRTGPWTWDQDGRDYTTSYDYICAAAGLHIFGWVTEGPGTAPDPEYVNVGTFYSILSTPEAKAHLNITKPLADGGAELHRFMQAATELVESKVGVCVRRDFTDRITEGGAAIALPNWPVLAVASVTSVWAGGPSWASGDLLIDHDAGIISPLLPLYPFWWGPWDVAYTCGRAVLAERWVHAAKEQLRHLWETQRGSQAPAALAGEEIYTATAGWSFSVPRRVLELLDADMVPAI